MSALDAAAAAAALLVVAWIAWRVGPADESPERAFLAPGPWPLWALAGSLVAAEISALTLVGVPAAVCGGDLGYAQFFVGSLVGRLLVGLLFLRALTDGGLTCYGWIGRRFGPMSERAAAGVFCAAKVSGAALRLVAAAVAASVLTGIGAWWWAAFLCAACAAYVGYGGLRAVVWGGVWQAAVLAVVMAAVCAYLLSQTPGHVHGALRLAAEGEILRFWHGAPGWSDQDFRIRWLNDPTIFWVAALNGFVGALAAFGCDHDFAQKLMACRDKSKAARVLAMAAAGSAAALTLLLTLGVCLYAYYRSHPALAVPEPLDRLFPHFAATVLPAPLRGLALAAVLLAAIDLPVSALSAATVGNLWRGLWDELERKAPLKLAAFWSAVLFLSAVALLRRQELLWIGVKGASVAAGPLLGLFLLGLLTKARGDRPAMAALALAVTLNARLLWLSESGRLALDWGWLTIIGAATAFILGRLLWRMSIVVDQAAGEMGL